jgi:lipopolysaccharide/colanic/teichoic acid biosynthesis glycosyltransferase
VSPASLKRDVRRTAEEAGSARANGVGVSHGRAELPLKSVETTRVASAAGFSGFLKRTVDIVVSLLAIILLAPVMLLIAILVKLDTPGPVLFTSRRIGRNREPFMMLKFRTMILDADSQRDDLRHLSEAPDGLFKIQNDPRLTRFGRYIRATSLDELPQLFQVLSGTMSLVGPRPLPPEEDALIASPGLRNEVRPGLTGPWQVAGSWRIPLSKMVEMDNAYLTNWSMWLDLKMVGLTFLHVVRRKGV